MGLTVDGRISRPYFDGISSFIQFARAVIDGQGNIPCPCLKCVNFYQISPEDVRIHLLQNGIMQSYIVWHEHGEPRVSDNVPHPKMKDKQDHDLSGIDALEEDRIRAEATDVTQGEEVRNFQKLLNDSQRELYPGSEDCTLLKFVIEAFNIKVTSHWSNKSFNLFLKFQSRLLPKGNLVPKLTYEARKILSDLSLSYELIDACINDCVLFWKENAMLDRCPRCNVSRLFMSRMISKAMRWHVENPSDGEESRHPTHSDEWKDFDVKHPEFALEPRNVRIGLAVDGFNPFGNMSNSYSMWPVILVPYNLPPWLAMKDSFFMLTLLVPGDKQPGIDIDVYMRLMVDELKELWQTSALPYDAFGREYFRMRAALSWTIMIGQHLVTYLVENKGKIAYINHRCYLPENHPERRKRVAYNGKQEKRKRSLELPVEKIQEQLNNITGVMLGKYPTNKKRPRYKPNWTKKSILYELPYFKDKKFRHNIDVMHVEKNFSENLIGTMLGIDGKNKDTDKARKDLEDKGIRKELWLRQHPNGSYIKPRATFQQESISSTLLIDIEDDIRYHREDVEVEVIKRVGPLDETYDEDDEDHEIMGDNINNEVGDDDEIPDADDMDPDMDYDV
ncbi:uncharacterized protein LOC130793173 [Actinidia eriantha]|uniref:uncharacterized protein LOC130793173 n=1 Tax=Actinidia eriantha TaxID=165200 RepID=UPI00258FE1FD|nr:uncharacterized protein LOC130793173 [Actinidia eriantha]